MVLVLPVPCQGGTVRGLWLVSALCHTSRVMLSWLWGPCTGTHGRGGEVLGAAFSLGHPGASPRCPSRLYCGVSAPGQKQLLGIGLGLGALRPIFP